MERQPLPLIGGKSFKIIWFLEKKFHFFLQFSILHRFRFEEKESIGSLTYSLHIAVEHQHPPPLKGKFNPCFSTLSEK